VGNVPSCGQPPTFQNKNVALAWYTCKELEQPGKKEVRKERIHESYLVVIT